MKPGIRIKNGDSSYEIISRAKKVLLATKNEYLDVSKIAVEAYKKKTHEELKNYLRQFVTIVEEV